MPQREKNKRIQGGSLRETVKHTVYIHGAAFFPLTTFVSSDVVFRTEKMTLEVMAYVFRYYGFKQVINFNVFVSTKMVFCDSYIII